MKLSLEERRNNMFMKACRDGRERERERERKDFV
jgi:hypothetical protein